MTVKIVLREESAQSRATALVQSLQLADLRAGREPVESRVAREVEARRERMVTEAVVGSKASRLLSAIHAREEAEASVLLEALRGLEYRDEPGRYCDHAAEPCDRCAAARAAIAKARRDAP